MSKTVFSISKPTPMWATWIFRIVFILTGVATFIIAGDPAIATESKIRIGVYLKGLDMAIWGITRMIGINISRDFNYEEGGSSAFNNPLN